MGRMGCGTRAHQAVEIDRVEMNDAVMLGLPQQHDLSYGRWGDAVPFLPPPTTPPLTCGFVLVLLCTCPLMRPSLPTSPMFQACTQAVANPIMQPCLNCKPAMQPCLNCKPTAPVPPLASSLQFFQIIQRLLKNRRMLPRKRASLMCYSLFPPV